MGRARLSRTRVRAEALFTMAFALWGLACADDEVPAAPGGGTGSASGGSQGGGSTGSADGGAPDDFVTRLAQTQCERLDHCCQRIGLPGAAEACTQNVQPGLEQAFRAREETGATFDPQRAETCLSELSDLDCSLLKDPAPWPDSCGQVFSRGDLALGTECLSDFECARPADLTTGCERAPTATQSLCVSYETATEGEPCSTPPENVVIVCASGTFCGPDGLCVPLAAPGQLCVTGPLYGDTCEPGALCDRLDTGVCIMPPPVGSTCASIEQCEGLACLEGVCREPLFETSAAGTCRAQ